MHTPGPWGAKYIKGKNHVYGNQWNICDATGLAFAGTHSRANARLIAAGPDLLSALKDLTNRLDALGIGEDERLLDQLKAADSAIAKATGE